MPRSDADAIIISTCSSTSLPAPPRRRLTCTQPPFRAQPAAPRRMYVTHPGFGRSANRHSSAPSQRWLVARSPHTTKAPKSLNVQMPMLTSVSVCVTLSAMWKGRQSKPSYLDPVKGRGGGGPSSGAGVMPG